MKLQAKTTLIIAVTWIVICLVIFADAKFIISRNYQYLEDQQIYHEVKDTERAFHKMLYELALYSQAFSQWDDAYHFMKDKNKKFIESNFIPGTYISSKMNFLIYFNKLGQLYYGKAYDFFQDKMVSIPASLLTVIADNQHFIRFNNEFTGSVGLVDTKEGLIALSAQPVLTSDGKGPSRGSLLTGYYLTDKNFSSLSELVGTPLKYISMHDLSTINPDYLASIQLALTGQIARLNINDNLAYGYFVLKDINQKPVGVIQAEISRVIHQQGVSTTRHYIIIVIILGFIVMFLLGYLLRIFVLNRVISIGNQVHEINQDSAFNKKLSISGYDELNEMVLSVNNMMSIISYSQSKLRYLASHDGLTQLPNRDYFYDLLNAELKKFQKMGKRLAVMFLDLDNFKIVNDTHGHAVGDKLIQYVVRRIKGSIRESDVLARQSGDEFLLFMRDISADETVSLTARKIIQAIAKPFLIDGVSVSISISIGISLYPDDGQTVDDLLSKADQAMYAIKMKSKNNFQFYDNKALVNH